MVNKILVLTGVGCLIGNFLYGLISVRGKWKDLDWGRIYDATFWQVVTLVIAATTLALNGI